MEVESQQEDQMQTFQNQKLKKKQGILFLVFYLNQPQVMKVKVNFKEAWLACQDLCFLVSVTPSRYMDGVSLIKHSYRIRKTGEEYLKVWGKGCCIFTLSPPKVQYNWYVFLKFEVVTNS